jgi:hypothetical protein
MELLYYLIFLLVSYVVLLQIFGLTTYHAYFWKALPLLIVFSILSGYLLYKFDLHGFFLWHVGLMALILFRVGRKQDQQVTAMMSLAGSAEEARGISDSVIQTKRYYAYSAFVYVITFAISYLYVLNA